MRFCLQPWLLPRCLRRHRLRQFWQCLLSSKHLGRLSAPYSVSSSLQGHPSALPHRLDDHNHVFPAGHISLDRLGWSHGHQDNDNHSSTVGNGRNSFLAHYCRPFCHHTSYRVPTSELHATFGSHHAERKRGDILTCALGQRNACALLPWDRAPGHNPTSGHQFCHDKEQCSLGNLVQRKEHRNMHLGLRHRQLQGFRRLFVYRSGR